METGIINQTVDFAATPQQVYDLLMDEKLYSEFAGEVTVSNEINGTFSVFDGYCTGYNIELVAGEKIVQAWNFKEDGWPDDHYSTCTFIFKKTGNGCQLEFTQTGIPQHKVEALSDGWDEYYWQPMKDYLAEM